jgi:hypothetical protein
MIAFDPNGMESQQSWESDESGRGNYGVKPGYYDEPYDGYTIVYHSNGESLEDSPEPTIWISNGTGKGKTTVEYQKGKLINKDGTPYIGTDNYILTVKNVIDNLMAIKDYRVIKVIEDLMNSPREHWISYQNERGSHVKPRANGGEEYYHGPLEGKRWGSNMKFNPNWDYKLGEVSDLYEVQIAHELWHMWDFEMGNFKGEKVSYPSADNQREIDAVNFENIIRREYNQELRIMYGGEYIDPVKLEYP